MAANQWFAQSLADLLGVPVDRPEVIETTALGAAYMAGLGIGWYDSLDRVASHWRRERRFEVQMPAAEREALYRGWGEAVSRVLAPSRADSAASRPA
jgi:glycerol kinase